jgi:predicted mannosyl-3-phosphoglycerate phosphatase (HAD superfamily)
MITLTDMDDAMIAKITGLTVEEVAKLREASRP